MHSSTRPSYRTSTSRTAEARAAYKLWHRVALPDLVVLSVQVRHNVLAVLVEEAHKIPAACPGGPWVAIGVRAADPPLGARLPPAREVAQLLYRVDRVGAGMGWGRVGAAWVMGSSWVRPDLQDHMNVSIDIPRVAMHCSVFASRKAAPLGEIHIAAHGPWDRTLVAVTGRRGDGRRLLPLNAIGATASATTRTMVGKLAVVTLQVAQVGDVRCHMRIQVSADVYAES